VKYMQVAIATDQFFNTLAGGFADETISARAWRERNNSQKWHYIQIAIDLLFFWQPDHCYASYLSETNRNQYPKEYRID
jgi:heme O synthase-like polyprenyltransferase